MRSITLFFIIFSGFSAVGQIQIAGQTYSDSQLQTLLETPQCRDFIDYLEGQPTQGPFDEPEEASLKAYTFSAIVQDLNGNTLLDIHPNGKREDIYKLYSISKSATALAFGRLLKLVGDGIIKGVDAYGTSTRLSLESRLVDFLPPENYPEAVELIHKKMAESPTARHLLSMASGIPWCEYVSCSSRDTLKMNYGRREDVVSAYIANLRTLPDGELAAPGVRYNYSAGNAVLLHQMMRTFLGDRYESFFSDQFFQPLGIRNFRYERDKTGLFLGGSSLFLSGVDTAKIGQLLINDGQLKNSDSFIEASFVQLLKSPNLYSQAIETPAEIKIWEGPVGSSLWINRRLPNIAQFMPRVPESMYYSAGFYGQRLMVFPEHKSAQEQSFEGLGLGLVFTRLGAEPPIGSNSYSDHWNVTAEKFYKCFSGGKPVLEVPAERKNLPSACRSPQLTTLEEEINFSREFALKLYPYQIQAIEYCNCIFVQDNLKYKTTRFRGKTFQIVDEQATFSKCNQIYPMEWPDEVLPLVRPTRKWIRVEDQSVSVAGNPFQSHIGIDLGGGITNKVATAKYDPQAQSCQFEGAKPEFGFVGAAIVGPQVEAKVTSAYLSTQEKMQKRLEEIRQGMQDRGQVGSPVQDGCF